MQSSVGTATVNFLAPPSTSFSTIPRLPNFEGTAQGNPPAKRGYGRDGRPDCPQVCIGLVATKEGLPVALDLRWQSIRVEKAVGGDERDKIP